MTPRLRWSGRVERCVQQVGLPKTLDVPVTVEDVELPVVPPPAKEKIVSLKLFRFSAAPATLARATAELELMALLAPSWNVPP